MRLDVYKSPQLLATIYALRSVDRRIQAEVRKQTKAMAQPEFKQQIAQRSVSRLENRVIADTAVVTVSNQNVKLSAAQKGRPLSGGLDPKTNYAPVEFGFNAKGVTYDRKNRKRGGTHKVTRVIGTQFQAPRKEGPFWQSVRNLVPRFARLYVQTTVRTIGDAIDGKE